MFCTMPKTVIDSLYRISLKDLRVMGVLYSYRTRTIRMTRLNKMGIYDSLPLQISVSENDLKLSFTSNGERVVQLIPLVRVKSNFKHIDSSYDRFVCPLTGQRGYKLFFYNNRFCHRKAIENGCYSIQHRNRNKDRQDGRLNILSFKFGHLEKMEKELKKWNAKKFYDGVPTRKFRQYIKIYDSIPAVA